MIQELKKRLNFEINSVQFVQRDGLKFLDIELPDSNLESIESKSKIISDLLDEINLIEENYYLNIFSSGTEKEIELKNINLFLEKNLLIKLKKQYLSQIEWEGILVETKPNEVILKINNKGRIQKLKIAKEDITFIKTTAKLRKE